MYMYMYVEKLSGYDVKPCNGLYCNPTRGVGNLQ